MHSVSALIGIGSADELEIYAAPTGPQLSVVGLAVADSSGTATLLPTNGIPAQACGWNAQAIDVSTCTLTNVQAL